MDSFSTAESPKLLLKCH
uniref:Uncharacterized protein n=1 Tax=Anguilla anguilla TaxID=7936 RepID=A0A0E9U722_ANGAN